MKLLKSPLVYTLCIFLGATTGWAQDIIREADNLYSTGQLSAKVTVNNGSNRLEIRSVPQLQGSIRIAADDVDQISVVYKKKARTDSRSRAIDYIDLIRASVNSTPQGVALLLHAPNPVRWDPNTEAGLIDAEIVVPKGCRIEIDAAYFDINATGPFSAMIVPTSLGKIQVNDVDGELQIGTSNRRVTIENIRGRIEVSTINADLEAFEIDCSSHQAIFRNEAGDISIDGIVGSVNVKNSFGRIEIERFVPTGDKNYIRGQSGPIMVQIDSAIAAELVLRNQNEDIEISVPSSLAAEFQLAVGDDGKIETSGIDIVADIVQHNRLILHSATATSRISGSIRGEGNIYLTGVD